VTGEEPQRGKLRISGEGGLSEGKSECFNLSVFLSLLSMIPVPVLEYCMGRKEIGRR